MRFKLDVSSPENWHLLPVQPRKGGKNNVAFHARPLSAPARSHAPPRRVCPRAVPPRSSTPAPSLDRLTQPHVPRLLPELYVTHTPRYVTSAPPTSQPPRGSPVSCRLPPAACAREISRGSHLLMRRLCQPSFSPLDTGESQQSMRTRAD